MKKKITIFIILALLIVGGLMVVKRRSKAPDFKVEKAKKGEIVVSISASGEIKADEDVTLKFQTSGYLNWVGVKKGDRVKKWQAIASLDKRELEKDFKKEMNDFMNERWDFEQTQDDYKATKEKRLVTDSIKRILEKAQFDLENSVLDAEISDLAVKFATIFSPIDGVVVAVDAPWPGVNITPATASFRIVNPKTTYFETQVDETDVSKIEVGDKVKITLDTYPGQIFESTIEKIAFDYSTTSGGGTAYNAKIPLAAGIEKEVFRLGMNGDATIISQSLSDILLVSFNSLVEKGGKNYLWKVQDGKAKRTEVTVGVSNDEQVQIISGIKEGEQYLSTNLSLVKEGMVIPD